MDGNARASTVDLRKAPESTKDPILTVRELRRSFGGLAAVDVEFLEVQRGWITALIGPNGAGKTTLFNLLTGFDRPHHGHWTFDGVSLERAPAYKVARSGMVRTFQLTRSLTRLTVLENLLLAARNQRGERFGTALFSPWWKSQEQSITRRADELLDRFRLTAVRDDRAGTLSGGQRKLLEMARALMAEPRMVMLDEPMAGVNPALAQSLLSHITDLRDDGMTVLFVEHDMDVVMGISDWVVCMAAGKIIAEGTPEAVGRNPAVIDAYLGTEHGPPPPATEEPQ